MGLRATYLAVDAALVERLRGLDLEACLAQVAALRDTDAETADLDKMWDGLRFLLSEGTPGDGDPLTEAVLGVQPWEGAVHVAVTGADDVVRILEALDTVDLDRRLALTDFADFADADIYPAIWDEDPDDLRDELRLAFADLHRFYGRARAAGHGAVVTIG